MNNLLTLGFMIIASFAGIIVIETVELKITEKVHKQYIETCLTEEQRKEYEKGIIIMPDTTKRKVK